MTLEVISIYKTDAHHDFFEIRHKAILERNITTLQKFKGTVHHKKLYLLLICSPFYSARLFFVSCKVLE